MVCFILTDCDKTAFIKATESVELSTELYPERYLPGLNCRFRINTADDFWLKIDHSSADPSGGSLCSRDFLEIIGKGRFCRGRPLPAVLHISSSTVEMVLHTGAAVEGHGLNMTISSIRKQ